MLRAQLRIALVHGHIELAHLRRGQALCQGQRRGGDLHRDALHGVADLRHLSPHVRWRQPGLPAQLVQLLQPGDIARQLGAAMPGQVLLQAGLQPVFLLLVEADEIADPPGDDQVEVAVGQVEAAAGGEQQGTSQ
ncbi:hypothetical protein D3C85_1377040 [compost metagenome]